MDLELTAIWSGDVHGPSRGYLCDAETVFPTRPPPILPLSQQPKRRRKKRDDLDLTLRSTVAIRALLRQREYTIVALMQKLEICRTSVDRAIKALKYHGLIISRELPRATYGRKQRVYGIQEDGKTTA